MAQQVTDTELTVLKVLWDRRHATAREITEVLYPACTEAELGTVYTMLKRLEKKNFVSRDRTVYPHQFSATVEREDVAGMELQAMAQKLSDGSMAPFLMHLIDSQRLSRKEAAEIRAMLQNYRPKK